MSRFAALTSTPTPNSKDEANNEIEEDSNNNVDENDDLFNLFASDESGLEGLDFLLSTLQSEDFEVHESDALNLNAAEVFDILGTGKRDTIEKPDVQRRQFPGIDFKINPSHRAKHYDVVNYIPGEIWCFEQSNSVYLGNDDSMVKVGKCKRSFKKFKIEITDCFEQAMILSEEVACKGTGLGYSSLAHSAACIAFMNEDAVLEPVEGYDLIREKITIEVTGANYDSRLTGADICVNKYAVLQCIKQLDDQEKDLLLCSHYEDNKLTDHFRHGAFDQEDSPYTNITDKLHDITSMIEPSYMEYFYVQFRHYLSSQQACKSPTVLRNDDTTVFDECLKTCGKKRGEKLYYPAPFRAFAGESLNFKPETLQVEPWINAGYGTSTFHNFEGLYDPTPYFFLLPKNMVKKPESKSSKVTSFIFAGLLKYELFQSVYIESELVSKINGNRGCFFSVHTNCGIAWKRPTVTATSYNCCYYTKTQPPVHYGTWDNIDPTNDIWRSPTFKISFNDIEYLKMLPHRIVAMCSAIVAYGNKGERLYVMQQIIKLMATMRQSTWFTSNIAGDMRFITLCTISQSGNICELLDKAARRITKQSSFSDFYLVLLLRNLRSRMTTVDVTKTPLLGMPLRFVCIEKDLPNCYMWHMRKGDHATNCFKKLVEGIKSEKLLRHNNLTALNLQYDYLQKAITVGVSQMDFNVLMANMPNHPYYNHIIFMGLSSHSSKTLDAGKRQDPTQVRLVNLISDRHSTKITNPTNIEGATISMPRVADGLADLFKEYGCNNSVHRLLRVMNKGRKLTNIYTIHPKDSAKKDREIPQMTNYMRVPQFVSENLLSIYTDADPADMMQNPEKFVEFAEKFAPKLRKGGISRSEDKSFFCGHMHPEMMALATQVVAITTTSASIITAAALTRCDKSRWTVLPDGCDTSIVDGIQDRVNVVLTANKRIKNSVAIKNFVHMMQGVRALGAAVINTTFSAGLDMMQKEMQPDLESTELVTTSDDSARATITRGETTYSVRSNYEDYVELPPTVVKHCMMIDEGDKPILSDKIAEFNNCVCGPNGLLPQQFIHTQLCIQPLTSETLIDDIISATSNARMALTWGDSIDAVRACFEANLILLKQKWLITDDEADILYDNELLPKCDEELIAGFGIKNQNTKLKLIRLIPEEIWEDVLIGDTNIIHGLRQFATKTEDKRSKIRLVDTSELSGSLKSAFRQINAARKIRGRINIAFMRPKSHQSRFAAKKRFMDALVAIQAPATTEETYLISQIPNKPNIVVLPTIPNRRDMMPCKQGNSARVGQDYNIKAITAFRIFGFTVQRGLTPDEENIATFSDSEYEKWLSKYKQSKHYEGLMFVSATGRPLMQSTNDTFFTRPMAFSYLIDVENTRTNNFAFTIEGTTYNNFRPCFYGGFTLQKAEQNSNNLAFGYAFVANDIHIFYQIEQRRPRVFKKDYHGEKTITIQLRDHSILCKVSMDLSAIPEGKFGLVAERPYTSNMIGDTTAILNYGNFLNTSSSGALSRMSKIFKYFKSSYPAQISKSKPDFPFYTSQSKSIPMALVNKLEGNRSITRLKLEFSEAPAKYQVIDLNGPEPILHADFEDDIEEDEVDYEESPPNNGPSL